MDAIDLYLARLREPAIRTEHRQLHGVEEGDREPASAGVADRHVTKAEEALGVTLPPSYRRLMTTVEPHDADYGIYWVRGEHPDVFGADIVSVNRGGDLPLPPFLIAVIGSDGGDEYCFDTRSPDARGEYPIVHFDHEIHDESSTDFEAVAEDLGRFLLGE